MQSHDRAGPLAIWVALLVPALWGLYWIPLRYLEAHVGAGAWSNVGVVLIACLAMLPMAWRRRRTPGHASRTGLWSTALGGGAFTLYSVALLYGSVATVIVLFYMTPVWSILIARFRLGATISRWRYAAIGLGLAGVFLVLNGGNASGLPLPSNIGDWMGLLSGILWSISSTGMNRHSRLDAAISNFIFCLGALLTSLLLGVVLGAPDSGLPTEPDYGAILLASLAIGILWWAFSLTAFMWSVTRVDPARLGIFMMTEVIMGAISSALLAAEPYTLMMALGTGLVVLAGGCEAYSSRAGRPRPAG
ncbi:EamA domain-containing membrane protein RarD [Kushneria sinocarnis]|uniref:EamA domain-containing membrane protein RarD n=1 Tax=Kushneria sinocarnis TaxID=595502 RepID=A0A420WWM4_9GAMM|nr:DMT family transporter [Kushneria sinocarnis]RKR03527.1 EamA domain-containing membrane protein RarD [Kushneria sinocarnis]